MKALNVAMLLLVAILVYVGTARAQSCAVDPECMANQMVPGELSQMQIELSQMTQIRESLAGMMDQHIDAEADGFVGQVRIMDSYLRKAAALYAEVNHFDEPEIHVAKALSQIHQMHEKAIQLLSTANNQFERNDEEAQEEAKAEAAMAAKNAATGGN